MNRPTVLKHIDTHPIGIDFGTSNSAMCRYVHTHLNRGPQIINFPITGNVLYPSVVLFDYEHHKIITGSAAYNKRFVCPENVVESIKRKICIDKTFKLGEKVLNSSDLACAIIIDFIKEVKLTDPQMGSKIMVVTVPYYFGANENYHIKQAVEKAVKETIGYECEIIIVPEPIAALLAFLYQNNNDRIVDKIFLVYDMGGGTMDLTLVKATSTSDRFYFEVLSNEGIAQFGGDDIDKLLYDYIIRYQALDFSTLTERQRRLNKARIMTEVKEAKHQLSLVDEYTIMCPNLVKVDNVIELPVSRKTLNALMEGNEGSSRNMLKEFIDCLERLYSKARISVDSVDYLVPIGGTSLIPLFNEYMSSYHKCAELCNGYDSIERFIMVAKGASIYAAIKSDELFGTHFKPFVLQNSVECITTRISHSLYIRKFDEKLDLIVQANSVSPTKIDKLYYPTKLRDDGRKVELNSIELFQAQGESKKKGANIGSVDFSDYEIYTHRRKLSEIPINLTFEATDTLVNIYCRIPMGRIDLTDIKFSQIVHY